MAERSAKVQERSRISNGRLNKHITDYSRKLEQLASFDEECQKILQNETVDESGRNNLIAEDRYFQERKHKQITNKLTEPDNSEPVDNLVKTRKIARKKSQKAYDPCFCCLNSAGIASTSAEISLNKLLQNHREELIRLSKQGISSDSKPFSDALQVLSINKEGLSNNQKIVILQPVPQNGKHNENLGSFCFREIQRKLKHTFGGTRKEPNSYNSLDFGDGCVCHGVDIVNPSNSSTIVKSKENLGNKQDNLKSRTCKKIDFLSGKLYKKQEVDVVLEANRDLSERALKNQDASGKSRTSKQLPTFLQRIISSLEDDFWPLSPRRDNITKFSPSKGQQNTCLSTLRTNTEVTSCNDYEEYNNTIESFSTETISSQIQSSYEEARDAIISGTDKMKSNGETNIENEAFARMYHLDMPENIKYHETHRSPVSVLEQIFTDDANSPSSIMLQTAKQRLKPRRLHFEESPFESPINEPDHISNYIHLVLKASRLSWDKLSKISSQSQELLNSSLFDGLKFLPCDSRFDPKLIFDHINEVLVKIHRTHLWLPSIISRICFSPLEELVVDEMMREAADFYLLHRTGETTLEQLVEKDFADSRLWFDVRVETEHIISDISEEILEESVLDVILGFGD
ncbi:hypothetical protein CDL12_25845 [Handroanthus impetiginosus]|uniref:DUF4378 domain-containing protein n=1 Tax=Handroanthus impetiginosus TaxID=429701 RepID=A0A2G9G8P2_9LAMI|nr:hypothetical protein CDL12_25845 [Handroanthus impetiginosus]